MLPLPLVALALASASAPAQAAPADDGAIAWACEREWAAGGATATVVRYLTATGRLTEMYVEWQVSASSGLVLSGFAGAEEREPSIADWHAHIGWSPTVYDPLGFLPQIVLGPWVEGRPPPNADRPERTVPDLDMKWSKLRRYARDGRLEASLVDRQGRSYRNGAIDLERVLIAIGEARKAVERTRSDARHYRTRCQPYELPLIVPA